MNTTDETLMYYAKKIKEHCKNKTCDTCVFSHRVITACSVYYQCNLCYNTEADDLSPSDWKLEG